MNDKFTPGRKGRVFYVFWFNFLLFFAESLITLTTGVGKKMKAKQAQAPVSSPILMPKATAVWLVENTSLTFEQIAGFCGLHLLEVKGIADGEVARDIRGADPIANGQLTREELDRAEKDLTHPLKAHQSRHAEHYRPAKKTTRYTPVSRRQDRPDAIYWFVKNHPEITDAQISKLLGTTKSTIEQVRKKTHWNYAELKPVDPVTLGLCSQIELDAVVRKAAEVRAKLNEKLGIVPVEEATLKPAGSFVADDEDDMNYKHTPSIEDVFGKQSS